METTEVRVGQVWEDNDHRCKGRTMRVDKIWFGIAVCTILTNSDEVQRLLDEGHDWYRGQDSRGRRTEIAVRRMRPTSTGYRLVADAPSEG